MTDLSLEFTIDEFDSLSDDDLDASFEALEIAPDNADELSEGKGKVAKYKTQRDAIRAAVHAHSKDYYSDAGGGFHILHKKGKGKGSSGTWHVMPKSRFDALSDKSKSQYHQWAKLDGSNKEKLSRKADEEGKRGRGRPKVFGVDLREDDETDDNSISMSFDDLLELFDDEEFQNEFGDDIGLEEDDNLDESKGRVGRYKTSFEAMKRAIDDAKKDEHNEGHEVVIHKSGKFAVIPMSRWAGLSDSKKGEYKHFFSVHHGNMNKYDTTPEKRGRGRPEKYNFNFAKRAKTVKEEFVDSAGKNKVPDPVGTGNVHANRAADKNSPADPTPPMPKVETLQWLTDYVGNLSNDDMKSFFEKMKAQFENRKQSGNESNAKSILAKEEFVALFGDDANLSEEFINKAYVLFESSVNSYLVVREAELEEQYASDFDVMLEQAIDEMGSDVEKFLDYMAEEWQENNQIAIEYNLRNQINESLVEGIKGLFVDSNIEIPEEDIDVVSEMEELMAEMEESYNALMAENIEFKKQLEEAEAEAIFNESSSLLPVTDKEKLRQLAEGISFSSLDEYKNKLDVLKEHHFTKTKKPLTDLNGGGSLVEEKTTPTKDIHPDVLAVAGVFSRNRK